MRAGRSTTQRLSLLALGVVALHVLLIGSVVDRLGAINAPQAARTSSGFAVRTIEYKQFGSQVDASVVPAQPTTDATADLRDESRDLLDRSAPLAARTAPPRAVQVQRGNTAGHTQRPVTAEPGRMAALAAPANTPSARVEAQPLSLQATDTEPIDTGPATAIESASAQSALQIYPTRIPTAFAFAYRVTRGGAAGEVELRWQPEGDRYVASLEGRDGDNALLAWRSVGGFDAAGIAPQRFVEHRRGRGALAVNFQRDAGKVTFSGPQIEHALAPGMQDRLSWMLQLAAIAAADSTHVGADAVSLIVVGVHGDAEVWNFEPVGSEALVLAEGAVPTLRLLRRPEHTYDTRAEVWLDPARHYLPLRVRLSNGGETLQLEWRAVAPSP